MKKTLSMLIIFLLCMCFCFRFESGPEGTSVLWFWQDRVQVPIILGSTAVVMASLLLFRWVNERKSRA